MTKRALTIIFFVLLMIFTTLYYFYDKRLHQNDIKSFSESISKDDCEDFQDFLYENHGQFIKLAVTLSKDMAKELDKGMSSGNRITFIAKDGEDNSRDIRYIIELPDDGRREFKFDKNSRKLVGYFRTFKDTLVDGTPVVDLIPISPKVVTKIK